ncbi:Uncharacterised protein [Pseudomonas fluorescens]|uniref:Uncharacterized protein n=1 Tax=Pseudomonas fluorescens TaxID=294 RepID=A0A3S4NX92_PSEFL|nr:Uncharacterised protein [Pseudomonas fluorescens]
MTVICVNSHGVDRAIHSDLACLARQDLNGILFFKIDTFRTQMSRAFESIRQPIDREHARCAH